MSSQPQVAEALPLQLGTDEQFKTVRDFLVAADYFDDAVRRRINSDVPDPTVAREVDFADAPKDVGDLLTWVLALGQYADKQTVQRFIPDDVQQAMEALGLLAHGADGRVYSPVFLCPTERLFCAADRWTRPDGSACEMPRDVVYPASSPPTRRFLQLIPHTPCQRALDIGSGTGIIAMQAASYAERVWASDLTSRCRHYAEFNRRLNGIDNLTAIEGDLYEAVGDQVFDRILAHPPYVPVLKPKWLFHDGGEDGEQLTRRIIAGLPKHLAPGGLFICDALGTDREASFEQRVRDWLGEKQEEFDVLLIVRKSYDPREYASGIALRNQDAAQFDQWLAMFDKLQIAQVLQLTIAIQRMAEARRVFTSRRTFGAKENAAMVRWLLEWETGSRSPQAFDLIMQQRPAVPASTIMEVRSRPGGDGFTPFEFKVRVNHPFVSESQVEPWMASLLNLCNGQRTSAELFDIAKHNGWIEAGTPPEKFAALISAFISYGMVEVPAFSLPPAGE